MEISKITHEYQTAIPLKICHFLQLSAGDALCYDISGDQVILSKTTPASAAEDAAFIKMQEAVMTEWQDAQDDDLLPGWSTAT